MTEDKFGKQFMPFILTGDWSSAFTLPFVTGQYYNVHWALGNQFTHMLVVPSNVWKPADKAIILRFNYTTKRETYDVQFYRLYKKRQMFNETTSASLSLNTLNLGSWKHDNISKYLFLGINGKTNGSVILDTVTCRKYCPKPPPVKPKDNEIKKWSDPNVWEKKVVHKKKKML